MERVKPYYQEPSHTIYCGHALAILTEMPAESVDMVITSPPYWGLRTYKTEPIIWGENHCEHDFIQYDRHDGGGHPSESAQVGAARSDVQRIYDYKAAFCLKCNAWRGELGLEPHMDCGRPLVKLRDDLSDKERDYVTKRLQSEGLI